MTQNIELLFVQKETNCMCQEGSSPEVEARLTILIRI